MMLRENIEKNITNTKNQQDTTSLMKKEGAILGSCFVLMCLLL